MAVQKQILLIENNAAISFAQQLRDRGFEVSTAQSGREVIGQLMRGREPDLIVTDIDLSDMDGFEFAGDVRLWSQVPIVIVSKIADTFVVTEAISQFADDYVTIPFDLRELVARIERILRHRL